MKNNKQSTHTPRELITEMQGLIVEAQGMLVDSVSEHSAEAMENLRERFSAAQERFLTTCDATKKKVIAGAKCTDAAIRENPYQSVLIALGFGVLVGIVAGRRGR
jgi:ElaB/YqjD/DUF883 family membrane-anchored ribosome-binding protein